MPYIDTNARARRRPIVTAADTPGELNYQISILLKKYVEKNGLSYQTINDCIGACEGAKLEFYRRRAAPYEDTKIEQNGDI